MDDGGVQENREDPSARPKIRTAENTNVSEMEISALTLGSLTVRYR